MTQGVDKMWIDELLDRPWWDGPYSPLGDDVFDVTAHNAAAKAKPMTREEVQDRAWRVARRVYPVGRP